MTGAKRLAVLASVMAASACASSAAPPANAEPATLRNADAPSVREAVRLFVREHEGSSVRADVDSLTRGPRLSLIALDAGPTDGLPDFRARPDYQLVADREGGCWLVQRGGDGAALRLPGDARCAPLSR